MNEDRSTTGEEAGAWPKADGLPLKLSRLRQTLGQKAKQEPKFRFYSLYGHILRDDCLMAAWLRQRKNGGSPGVDGVSFEQIEKSEGGVAAFLSQLRQELRNKTYKALPVRRTYIPKPGGKMRPLGIPAIRDRVVQMATLLILEPIFEADFEDCSYGFRPDRSAHQAIEEIRGHLSKGLVAVYDADLKGYFDSIPHDKLMLCLEMRISDRQVLKLVRMWLETPVVEPPADKGGKPTVSRPDKGTPQGGVISPLLSNLYLHWFDRHFQRKGPAQWAKAKLVRYADDFVVLARFIDQRITGYIESQLEGRFGLEINRDKTRVVNLKHPGGAVDFLGYTFRFDRDLLGRGGKYLNVVPSKKAVARRRETLRELTGPRYCFKPLPLLIADVNASNRGWKAYFKIGYPAMAYREINLYTHSRLARHAKRRSQRGWRKRQDESWYEMLHRAGLQRL